MGISVEILFFFNQKPIPLAPPTFENLPLNSFILISFSFSSINFTVENNRYTITTRNDDWHYLYVTSQYIVFFLNTVKLISHSYYTI